VLEAKQPGYHAAVTRFYQENPLAPIQRELRFHINRLSKGGQTALLFVVQASPFASDAAGVELNVRDLLRSLALPRVVVTYPSGVELVFAELLSGDVERPIFYRFPLSKPVQLFSIENEEICELLERALTLFSIGGVQVHQLLRWPLSILRVFKRAGLKIIYTSHDYYCVCPSWKLFDFAKRLPCNCIRTAPGDAGCLPALLDEMGMLAEGDLSILRERHRATWLQLLSDIDTWVFPSIAARETVRLHLPVELSSTRVIEHSSVAHRELYESLGLLRAVSLPPPATLPELYSLSDWSRTTEPSLRQQDAAPKYQSSSWYPSFLRLKPFVPKAIRMLGRKALIRLEKFSARRSLTR
jgi:hypothetical protein